jgi:hypothetical protein
MDGDEPEYEPPQRRQMRNTTELRYEEFLMDYAAPIPVGHRVEIVVFRSNRGLFKGKNKEPDMCHPWCRDLETGIEYGAHWHYQDAASLRFGSGNKYPPKRIQELEVFRKSVGKVVACRILTERASENWQMQTRLVITPDPFGDL